MRQIAKVVSWVSLLGAIILSILFYYDIIGRDWMIGVMNATMVIWFIATPLWMGREPGKKGVTGEA